MILALIPCRLESKRLKNKALLKLENITIIEHVIKRAQLCKFIDQIAVCTNSNLIIKVAKNLNIKTFKSKKKHNNGTERIAEYPLSKKVKYVIDGIWYKNKKNLRNTEYDTRGWFGKNWGTS